MDWVDDFPVSFFSWRGVENTPALNIEERDKEYKISLALPGVSKKDVTLSLADGVLTIQYEKKDSETPNEAYLHREFCYVSSKRSIRLPREGVDVEGIKADYKGGMLLITLPKREVTVRENTIPIG